MVFLFSVPFLVRLNLKNTFLVDGGEPTSACMNFQQHNCSCNVQQCFCIKFDVWSAIFITLIVVGFDSHAAHVSRQMLVLSLGAEGYFSFPDSHSSFTFVLFPKLEPTQKPYYNLTRQNFSWILIWISTFHTCLEPKCCLYRLIYARSAVGTIWWEYNNTCAPCLG